METFEGAVVCLLAMSLWSGISAKDAPLPEENMNVVSFSLTLVSVLKWRRSNVDFVYHQEAYIFLS